MKLHLQTGGKAPVAGWSLFCISAQMTDGGGNTNAFAGLVERDGRFWLENVPLNSGTNTVSITLSDVVGNTSVTNISLVQSALTLTLNPVSDSSQLWQPTVNLTGTVSDATYAVWVNGVQGTNNGDGTWSANNVPTSAGGVAIFDLTAYPPSEAPSGSLSGGSTVNPSAPDAVSVPGVGADKPVRLYVESYTLSPSRDHVDRYENDYDAGGDLLSWEYSHSGWLMTMDYHDGQPGENHYTAGGVVTFHPPGGGDSTNVGESYWDSYWPADIWPAAMAYSYSDSDGNAYEGTYGPGWPSKDGESANSADRSLGSYHVRGWDWSDAIWVDEAVTDTETYNAQTVVKLQTGGKALSQRQNLFQLMASAAQQHPARYNPDSSWTDSYTTAVPAQNITVAGKALGNDGNLWVMLSDNQTVDVTPKVKDVNDYTFGITATKYPTYITANGVDLDTSTPEFCVGQQVNLAVNGLPDAQINYQWIVSLDFVNDALNPVSDDGSYYPGINPAFLTNNPTPAWWSSGGNKPVWCKVNCQFANGQTIALTAEGNISIYKPSVSFVAGQDAIPMLTNNFLELGDLNTGVGLMTFDAQVTSKTNFSGTANWTQLNNRAVTGVSLAATTDGQFWLDNSRFYNDGVGDDPPPTIVNPTRAITFSDNPGVSSVGGDVSISDSFNTYLVFKPNDSSAGGSRWVTLGIVTWSWSALEIHWALTGSDVDQASYSDSDVFPQWPHTGYNSGH